MSNKGGASHKFAQTFFLAKQPNGYFVLNDIIRFLKEDIENEYEDFDTPNENYVSQDQYMDNQNSNIISEEIIEQMNESLVIDNDATLEEKENLETIETNPIVEEKKVENETFEKVEGPTSATAKLNDTQETNGKTATPETTSSTTQATTTTQASSTTTATIAPTTVTSNELTESATENETKRTNQVKSFATVTASNTSNSHATTNHYKEVPKVENKSLPNSNIQKTSQGRRQEQKINFEREIFIKDVNENISKDKLKEAFSKFGEVKNIDVFYNRVIFFFFFFTKIIYIISIYIYISIV